MHYPRPRLQKCPTLSTQTNQNLMFRRQPMKAIHALVRLAACAAFVTVSAAANTSQAATLTVTHWIDGMYGVPFAVALDKGYFKQNGVDVTGFITSEGGEIGRAHV